MKTNIIDDRKIEENNPGANGYSKRKCKKMSNLLAQSVFKKKRGITYTIISNREATITIPTKTGLKEIKAILFSPKIVKRIEQSRYSHK